MSRYYGGWAPYVPVAERRRKAEKEMEKLRKKGTPVSPVKIEGKKIAATFWGKAWCDNLEGYGDYENRLPRGRTYVRNGSVVDLQIAPREVTALVSGSSIYKVKVTVGEVAKAHWKALCAECSGGIDSLVELLQGRFSKGVMERICRVGEGLFPKPAEIKFTCSCPDFASMCKHVAAVLYGVGARLDAQPELLFRLRAVDEKDLVANIGAALPVSKKSPVAGKVLEADDMAALFGLDMVEDEAPAAAGVKAGRKRVVEAPKVVVRKSAEAKKAGVPPAAKGRVAAAAVEPVARRTTKSKGVALGKPVVAKAAVVKDAAGKGPVVKEAVAKAPVVQDAAGKGRAKTAVVAPKPAQRRKSGAVGAGFVGTAATLRAVTKPDSARVRAVAQSVSG